MSDDVRERVAQALYANYRMVYAEMSGAVPPSPAEIAELWEAEIHYKDQFYRQANVLAEAGLLAPAPLTEEWHAAYYGVTPDGVRHLRLIGTEGSREHAEETRADCAQDDPDTEFFLVRRPVHDWLPVNRAEGDGRAVSHE